ncbi:MAG: DNA polymerase III subunit alpha [Cytophagaceae bacterium]|nr:DNA polymerase III subunit alpha [Cytophagaceae bacterium]MDW8457159.1 DNA polymerase III subunit alpha [Cytophagaceae bacterium]
MDFVHLHVHTQFSLLDGAASIKALMDKAVNDEMKAVAITDHGNMFGVFQFVAEANKKNIKPIIGCEFYVVENRHKKNFTKEDRDVRYHQLLLAKNPEGYKNLSKLCSLGYIEGFYGKYPRIDKELILQYHKGLIATTCCIGAEVPRTILRKGEEEGEQVFKWWLDVFGDDYYVELQRHNIPDQIKVNEILIKFARKYNVKIIASNDAHYVNREDYNAHDILLCINTGEKQSTPTSKEFSEEGGTSKGTRFAFYNDEFYFKTKDEMAALFHDLPEAVDNTIEIVDKVEQIKLKRDILLPNFPIPEAFKIHTGQDADSLNQWEYLRHLAFEGAKIRYKEITPQIEERLNFELFTIKTMGFAGYFLIVADFIKEGRNMGVLVGPGRGSAAGSVVAYCIGITNIDPIKYDLLFERFLNPDRKSMPDIDTDFDDEGRQKVIDYVVQKYGRNQVAQIVTYSSMAAKMSIKDVARVLDLPLNESLYLSKLVPEKPGISLQRIIHAPLSGENSLYEKEGLSGEDLENVKKLREIYASNTLQSTVLKEALVLEGSVRGTGIHAAGIIIAPKDLTELIPVATSKDSDLLLTQYEGQVIEEAGVIKMDFLGLRTLTIIKQTIELIEKNHGIRINIDEVDLTDKKTFELYQRGETNATFQFESAGMQKYLRDLRPDKFADLIAMNALYRPGPLEYIPNYIRRKHGKEPIIYDLPEMEEYLKETYGITVYQEQVMLLSQKLAGFSKGDADVLRKAMGKKDRATLDKMKSKFLEGAMAKGHPKDKLEKIWTDWEAFAAYAFNKSHSTCYAFLAFQTAWLKAHYPAEYMAAVLTNNMNNIEKISFFLEECRRMNIPVLGPDINESSRYFDVNKEGKIRFGLGAIKGAGDAAIEAIMTERQKNGPFKDIFDFVQRINLRTFNKKTFECFVYAGAFDSFGIHRAQYFAQNEKSATTIEILLRYGATFQQSKDSAQQSLFGGSENTLVISPKLPNSSPWHELEKLKYEKEVVGIYISGHPLDQYKVELENFCNASCDKIFELRNKDNITIAGMVTQVNKKHNKQGKPYALFTVEDYNSSVNMALFGEEYLKYEHLLKQGEFLFIKGKTEPRRNNPDELEFRPTFIQLLADVRAKWCKAILVMIELANITSYLIDELEELFLKHKGNSLLRICVHDNMSLTEVEMFSRKIKIDPCDELLNKLNRLPGVHYKLIS